MRLFHVSEESDIKSFVPRKPSREDLSDSPNLVWAVTEACLANFLTPRDCPRVTYHVNDTTSEEDKNRFFSSSSQNHCLVIESKWYEPMKHTKLYIYEFEIEDFYLQDSVAGYYVSEKTQVPISVHEINDLFAALCQRNVEVRIVDNLHELKNKLIPSTLNWSMCRMKNSIRRKYKCGN